MQRSEHAYSDPSSSEWDTEAAHHILGGKFEATLLIQSLLEGLASRESHRVGSFDIHFFPRLWVASLARRS